MSTKYILISSPFKDKFEQEVDQHLCNGWELHGSVQVDDGMFYQAMVRNMSAGTSWKTLRGNTP